MNYNIHEIQQISGAHFLNETIYPSFIDEIFFDTRKGSFSNNALFIAIDGKNTDGHQHIKYAYDQLKIRNFLISKAIPIDHFPESNFLISNNVIGALQILAAHHRSKYSMPVIGITGSNGKTIIKEWIFQLAGQYYNIVRSPGSYNSQLGVPLSVLNIENHHELGVFEAGISHLKEMDQLNKVIKPTIGIIANIGEAHSAGFGSKTEKLREKLKLFKGCQKIIYRKDIELIHHCIEELKSKSELISWSSIDPHADYFITSHSIGQSLNLFFNNKSVAEFEIPFQDEIAFENAVSAIISCLEAGVPVSEIQERSPHLKTVKMRMEFTQGINNSLLINDSYNSDLLALSSALNILDQQQKKHKNTLILSQIEESNLSKNELLEAIAQLIIQHPIDKVIAIGHEIIELQKFIPSSIEVHFFEDTYSLLNQIEHLSFYDENILIKGARKFSLDKIFDVLSTKVHQTILEIDMEALRHNLSVFRSYLHKDTKLMVVLKASGYGSGAKELARFLSYQHVDYIAVAYTDEGIELRNAGIQIPIMVMNPEEAGFRQMVEFHLEPEIYSIEQIKQLLPYLKSPHYPIHLKIETGMHRLGFEFEDLQPLLDFIKSSRRFFVKTVFSHLIGSDNPEHDQITLQQIEKFEKAYQLICTSLSIKPERHILNSNGISRFPDNQYEMVRLGIGLHGIIENQAMAGKLQKVQTLKTHISQIKTLKKGDTVGYSLGYIASEPVKIATINIGYADGLPRNAGNQNYSVGIKGLKAPIVGNVCMDMCMVDVTHIDTKIGDEVIVFGKEWPIEDLAKACKTIPYEILTRLSTRIHRIFSRE